MPGQLLPLRLLHSSSAACLAPIKFRSLSISSSTTRPMTIFATLFPFKLKYQALAFVRQEPSGIRRFSSRSIHSRRGGDDRRNSEFLRGRGSQRGKFQPGSLGGRAGQAKSLIEDEAELSDWVSDLKMDSVRLSSDSDDSDDRSRARDRESVRNRGGMGRERFSSSKRQRESDSDDFPVGGRNGSSRSSGGLRNSRVSGLKRRFDSESKLEDEEDFPSRRRKEYGSRRDVLSSLAERGGRRSGMNNRRGQERGNLERGGRGLERQSLQFLDDEEDEEEEDEVSVIEDSEDEKGSGKGASSLSEMVKESATPKPSSGKSDSYLSETRYARVQQLLALWML